MNGQTEKCWTFPLCIVLYVGTIIGTIQTFASENNQSTVSCGLGESKNVKMWNAHVLRGTMIINKFMKHYK
jgi:hypothetical protein